MYIDPCLTLSATRGDTQRLWEWLEAGWRGGPGVVYSVRRLSSAPADSPVESQTPFPRADPGLLKFSQSLSLTFNTPPTPASPWKPSQIMLRRRWELLSPLFAQILGSWGTSWLYLMGFHHFFSFCKKNSLISCLASNRCKGWMLVCGIICLVA